MKEWIKANRATLSKQLMKELNITEEVSGLVLVGINSTYS